MAGPLRDRPSLRTSRRSSLEEDLQAQLNAPRDVALGRGRAEACVSNGRIRRAEINAIENVARCGLEPHILLLAKVCILVDIQVLIVVVWSPDVRVSPPIVAEGKGVRDRKADGIRGIAIIR